MVDRYEEDWGGHPVKIEDGQYVLYEDHVEYVESLQANHLAVVQKLEARIKELEGKVGASYSSGYHRGVEYKSQEGPFG